MKHNHLWAVLVASQIVAKYFWLVPEASVVIQLVKRFDELLPTRAGQKLSVMSRVMVRLGLILACAEGYAPLCKSKASFIDYNQQE